MEGQASTGTRPQRFHNFIRDRHDALVTHAHPVQRQVELAVRAHQPDEPVERLTNRERPRQIAMIEQAAMRMVHRRVVAERGFSDHEDLHGLALRIRGHRQIKIPVEPRTRDDAIRSLIQRYMYHEPVALPERCRLLTNRQQQVLFQSPIEKHSDSRVHAHHPQKRELAHGRIRSLGRRDQPVLGVAIDEHVNARSDERKFRQITPGQQNLPVGATIEVISRSRLAHEGE